MFGSRKNSKLRVRELLDAGYGVGVAGIITSLKNTTKRVGGSEQIPSDKFIERRSLLASAGSGT